MTEQGNIYEGGLSTTPLICHCDTEVKDYNWLKKTLPHWLHFI